MNMVLLNSKMDRPWNAIKELQSSGTFTDMVFVCAEQTKIRCHKAILQRHSPMLTLMMQRYKGCCCNSLMRTNSCQRCNDIEEEMSVILPDIDADTVRVLLSLVYTGEATVTTPMLLDELHEVCRLLCFKIPVTVSRLSGPQDVADSRPETLNETNDVEEVYEKDPLEVTESSEGTLEKDFQEPKRKRARSSQSDQRSPKKKRIGTKTQVYAICPPLEAHINENQNRSGNDSLVNDDDDDASLNNSQEMPMQNSTEVKNMIIKVNPNDILNESCVQDGYENKSGMDQGTNLHINDFEPKEPNEEIDDEIVNEIDVERQPVISDSPHPERLSNDDDEENDDRVGLRIVNPMRNLMKSNCPTCGKLYSKGKIREHLASTHLNIKLRTYVDVNAKKCKLCPKTCKSIMQIARHVGLAHNKIMEFANAEELKWLSVLVK